MKMQQDRVTTNGAQGKGTTAGMPYGNHGGPASKAPARSVTTGNCAKYAFPTTGGRRKDSMSY